MKFAAGKKYRVARPGASLGGWKAMPGGHQGWSRPLAVGEVIECAGRKNGIGSDPIPEVMFSDDQARQAGASAVTFEPSNWGTPKDGYLEEIAHG